MTLGNSSCLSAPRIPSLSSGDLGVNDSGDRPWQSLQTILHIITRNTRREQRTRQGPEPPDGAHDSSFMPGPWTMSHAGAHVHTHTHTLHTLDTCTHLHIYATHTCRQHTHTTHAPNTCLDAHIHSHHKQTHTDADTHHAQRHTPHQQMHRPTWTHVAFHGSLKWEPHRSSGAHA